MHQKNVIFVIIGIFKARVLSMNHISAMAASLIQKAMSFNDAAGVSVKGIGCRICRMFGIWTKMM